jgi:hypothetical protein
MRVKGKQRWARRAAAVAAGAAIVVLAAGAERMRAQGSVGTIGSSTQPDSYDADFTLRYQFVDAAGQEVRTRPPAVAFHLTRRRHRGGWQTSLTLQGIERPVVQTSAGPKELDNPFLVSRMEYDEDGTPPRLFNRRGEQMEDPARHALSQVVLPADLEARAWSAASSRLAAAGAMSQRFTERDPLAGLVTPAADHAARQRGLERQFGRAVGRVRGLDQYRTENGDQAREVLVRPTDALPIELNTTRHGALVDHALFTYDSLPSGLVVRHHVHAEHLLDETDGIRSVADLDITNVRLGIGRAQ